MKNFANTIERVCGSDPIECLSRQARRKLIVTRDPAAGIREILRAVGEQKVLPRFRADTLGPDRR